MNRLTPTASPHVCALCADEIWTIPSRQPLGRDNALVDVCADCDGAYPRTSTIGPRGYTGGSGPALGRKAVVASLRRSMGDAVYEADAKKRSRAGNAIMPSVDRFDAHDDYLFAMGRRRV